MFRKSFGLVSVVLVLFQLSASLSAQPASPPPPARQEAVVPADLADIPGDLLLALGRKARVEGEYAKGIHLLETALQSPYGEREFARGLSEAVKASNLRLEADMHKRFENSLGKSGIKDVVELTLKNLDGSRPPKNEAQHLQIQTRISLKNLDEKIRKKVYLESSRILEEELKKRFPKNPLKFYHQQDRYYLEGYFNSEYPDIIPMAHYELGLLYRDYQDFLMAQSHLELAIQNKQYFPSREMVYAAAYELADLFLFAGKINKYEDTLNGIVQDQDLAKYERSQEDPRQFLNRLTRLLQNDPEGMDKVIKLYRLPDDFSREAHRLLGYHYLRQQNFELSLNHLVLAVLQTSSTLLKEIRNEDPDYEFSSLEDLLRISGQKPEFSDYLEKSRIYESIYALATAVLDAQAGKSQAATRLMKTLANLGEQAGTWSEKARRFLKG